MSANYRRGSRDSRVDCGFIRVVLLLLPFPFGLPFGGRLRFPLRFLNLFGLGLFGCLGAFTFSPGINFPLGVEVTFAGRGFKI